MPPRIAFVGAGPTAIYTLQSLVNQATVPFALTIFEEQSVAGRGTPYRPGWNDPAMLSNIASIEIPPLEETLIAWLARQSPARLAELEIDAAEIDERAFYPRLTLGVFFKDQFEALIARARAEGNQVEIRTRCRVTDVVSAKERITLSVQPQRGAATEEPFDHLVIATGHQWPEHPEVRPRYFLSPWPASALANIPPCSVGIRGSSLTAIDAAVALATGHGEFVEQADRLLYRPAPNTSAFRLTMLSRKGLLPEADFYHPVPYEPLAICTSAAVERLIGGRADEILDQAFALFKLELAAADPGYAEQRSLAQLTLETFCDSYFAARTDADPFTWAEENLREAERNNLRKHTVAWRYAILRMHEVITLIVPHLSDEDFERFSRYFKPVFVDDYATIPHESIKRLLALHNAGKLEIKALGERYRVDSHRAEGGAVVQVGSESLHFPAFIEATGQRPLAAKEFPFPSLLSQGIVRDESSVDPSKPTRGIVIDDRFHPVADGVATDQLFCLSLPFLLGRHPFIQGITSSQEMGAVVGAALAAAIARAAQARVGAELESTE
ncbi:MAG: FAD/NAD(P)-binding protein [Polyangiaceae bacterium]